MRPGDAAQKFATFPITFSLSRRNLRCCVTMAVTEIIASLLVCLCQSPIEKWRPSSVQQKDKMADGSRYVSPYDLQYL